MAPEPEAPAEDGLKVGNELDERGGPGAALLSGCPRSRAGNRPCGPPAARAAALALLVLLPGSLAQVEAKVFLTQEEALALAFGEASRARRVTAFLTNEQVERAGDLAGGPLASRVVVYYTGTSAAGATLTAFFDTHLVRTLPETVMVVVGADARIVRLDILSFDEPEDYLPRARWLEQFEGRPLDEDLSTRRAIRAVTGATMSSRAVTETARRALALHEVLRSGTGEQPPVQAPSEAPPDGRSPARGPEGGQTGRPELRESGGGRR